MFVKVKVKNTDIKGNIAIESIETLELFIKYTPKTVMNIINESGLSEGHFKVGDLIIE